MGRFAEGLRNWKPAVIAVALMVVCVGMVVGRSMIDRTIAKINDDILMESDLAEVVADLRGDFQSHTAEAFARATTETVQSLFDRTLLVQEAKRMGIAPGSDDLNDQVETMVRDLRAGFKSETEFHRALAAERMSLDRLKQELLKKTKTDFMVFHVINSQVPSGAGGVAHGGGAMGTAMVSYRLRRLGIPIDKKNGAQHACREVQALVARIITEGITFEEGVRRYSKVPDAELDGGDLGYLAADKLNENVLKALEGLEVGHATVPVVAGGYANVFYLEGKRGEKSAQRERAFFETRESLLERLRRRAVLQIYDERLYGYLSPDYAGLVDGARAISKGRGGTDEDAGRAGAQQPILQPAQQQQPGEAAGQYQMQQPVTTPAADGHGQQQQRGRNPVSRWFGRNR